MIDGLLDALKKTTACVLQAVTFGLKNAKLVFI